MLLLRIPAHWHGGRSLRLMIWRRQSPVASSRRNPTAWTSVHSHVSTTSSSSVHHHPVLLLRARPTHAMHRSSRSLLLLRIPLELLLVLRISHVMHVRHSVAMEGSWTAWETTRAHSARPHDTTTTAHHPHSAVGTTSSRSHSVRRRRAPSHATRHRMLPFPTRPRSHRSGRHLVVRLLLVLRMRGRSSRSSHTSPAEHHPAPWTTSAAVATHRSAIVAIVFR